jgi:hypothetical protein
MAESLLQMTLLMRTNHFKVTIHMVASLDGFIAKKDNSVSWFEASTARKRGNEQNTEAHKP